MSRATILSLVFLLLVGALIAYSLTGVNEVSCEVCITFKGQSECRTGKGRTQEDAVRSATEACCAVMPTSGMSERVKCSQTPPSSLSCD
jgi:hypothetical protein